MQVGERLSKKDTTHLICAKAEGNKWERAVCWKIVIVSELWLDECVRSGAWQPQPPPSPWDSSVAARGLKLD